MKKNGFTLVELIIVVSIFLIMFAALTPFVRLSKERAGKVNCATNLRHISLGLHKYALEHDDAFPQALGELYPNYVSDEKVFGCPAGRVPGSKDSPNYKYMKGLTESSPPKEIIVEDLDDSHGGMGKNILYVNGSVEWIGKAKR